MARPASFSTSTQKAHALWRLLFVCFVFCYLAFFQREILRLTLSEYLPLLSPLGPVASAALFSLLLLLLNVWHSRRLPFSGHLYILNFVPEFIAAAVLTSLSPTVRTGSLTVCLGVLAVWFWAATRKPMQHPEPARPRTTLRQAAWSALLFLALQVFTAMAGHNDTMLHYELRAWHAIEEGRYEDALRTGERSDSVSPTLFALRMYAASQLRGGLGTYLFKYPVPAGGGRLLLPAQGDYPASVCRALLCGQIGRQPRPGESVIAYTERAAHRSALARDYFLATCLLDKQLDKFAHAYKSFHPDTKAKVPPLYYAEALLLYSRLRTAPVIVYRNNAIQANFDDFNTMEKKYASAPRIVRRNELRQTYGETFWWYFLYQ